MKTTIGRARGLHNRPPGRFRQLLARIIEGINRPYYAVWRVPLIGRRWQLPRTSPERGL